MGLLCLLIRLGVSSDLAGLGCFEVWEVDGVWYNSLVFGHLLSEVKKENENVVLYTTGYL